MLDKVKVIDGPLGRREPPARPYVCQRTEKSLAQGDDRIPMTPDQTVLLLDLMLACGAAYLTWLSSW
jgi:hypothetical protein